MFKEESVPDRTASFHTWHCELADACQRLSAEAVHCGSGDAGIGRLLHVELRESLHVDDETPLASLLRGRIGSTSPKVACDQHFPALPMQISNR